DASGNLFGATAGGGPDFSGTIFEFSPRQSGKWKEQIPYAFCAPGCDSGQSPTGIIRDETGNAYGMTAGFGPNGKGGTLFEDAAGHLFGTTSAGGRNGGGTIFEVTP